MNRKVRNAYPTVMSRLKCIAEIFRMLAESHSKEDIAQVLNLSPKTVANCHYLIKSKLNVGSDIELIYLAIRMQVINFSELSGSDVQ